MDVEGWQGLQRKQHKQTEHASNLVSSASPHSRPSRLGYCQAGGWPQPPPTLLKPLCQGIPLERGAGWTYSRPRGLEEGGRQGPTGRGRGERHQHAGAHQQS